MSNAATYRHNNPLLSRQSSLPQGAAEFWFILKGADGGHFRRQRIAPPAAA
jgi:hypothetical protein